MGEHAFTKNPMPEVHQVQAANEHVVLPDFNAVGVTGLVQIFVSRLHALNNPSALLPRSWRAGTSADDLVKSLVDAEPVFTAGLPASDGLSQATAQLEAFNLQNHARIGRPPQNGLLLAEPRKDPL